MDRAAVRKNSLSGKPVAESETSKPRVFQFIRVTTLADHMNGRHNRGSGFAADLEKYLEASLAKWQDQTPESARPQSMR